MISDLIRVIIESDGVLIVDSDAKWYIVTIIIKSQVNDNQGSFTCDEQIRLIKAFSLQNAFDKASGLGKNEETSYLNVDGQLVSWLFVGVESIELMEDGIVDGIELRSRLFGHSYPEKLVQSRENLALDKEAKKSIRDEDLPVDE